MVAIPELGEVEWAGIKKGVKRSKGQVEAPPPPKASDITRALNDQQKRVATEYVRSGGNIAEAVRSGGYEAPAPQTFARLEQIHAFRVYVALLFEHVARKRAQIRERQQRKKGQEALQAAERIAATSEAAPLAQIPPGEQQDAFMTVVGDIAECIEQARGVLRAKVGDFLTVMPDGRWEVDVDLVKKAGPGIIKSFSRDKFGEMTITLGDHAEARQFLAAYHQAKTASGREANRGDTRTLMLNIVLGDNATFDQIDQASKAMGAQLRALREAEQPVRLKRVAPVQEPVAVEPSGGPAEA